MTHEIDRLIEAVSESATRLDNADIKPLAAFARDQLTQLKTAADLVVGPLRRWQAVVGNTGKDWLGEPYRTSYRLRSFIVHFISRETDRKLLAEEARQTLYCFHGVFSPIEDWTVVDLQPVVTP